MAKLSLEQIKEKVYKNSLQTCEYLGGYENGDSIIIVKCLKHNHQFTTRWENVRREGRAHHICPLCQQEDKENKINKIEVECAYCHKIFMRYPSKLKNSKSGLYFCCREHKDAAQRLESGENFDIMRPDHYGQLTNSSEYRKMAFRNYPSECEICHWNEDSDVLEVHHIDENRDHNTLENLIILCPICHKKLTTHKYILDREHKKIIKKEY